MKGQVAAAKVGRNDPCPCGSGKKFKHCCQGKDARAQFRPSTTERPSLISADEQNMQALAQAAKAHWEAGRYADAAILFSQIALLRPSSAEAHYDLGRSLLRCGRLAEAIASLERAVELRPGFVEALGQSAYALEGWGKEPEALFVYRRLSRLADNSLDRLYYSAKALTMEGKLDEAEETLRRMLVLAPDHAGTRSILGSLLLDRGRFEEAEAELTKAIDALPGAFHKLTGVRRMTEAHRPLIERMRSLVDGPGVDRDSRVDVEFGLGKAYDDLGDYAEAIRHYDTANRLRATSSRFDRAARARQYDSLIARSTREALERAARSLGRSARHGDELPVFIVGMPRSGTTLLEQILSSHPAVAAAGELPFWRARVLDWSASKSSPDAAALAKAADDYLALLRGVGPEELRVTDKAPRNFEFMGLIRVAFPDARIIHCRRHPVDTCLSIFFTNFWEGQDYSWDRGDLVFQYRQYERLMDHWRKVLPDDRFTEVQYEALVTDREAETRRLISFIGLDWDDACLAPERNERAVRTASVWQARQPVYKWSVERWRRYEAWLGELQELLPESEASAARREDSRGQTE